jgi:sigma-B regulation protein RsbU (phosphoserine phosphatase)
MKDSSNVSAASSIPPTDADVELDRLRVDFEQLQAEYDDLKLLYEAMIEHGEAVEDQLAEQNTLLERTQARLDEELNDAGRYVFSILPDKRAAGPATDWLLVPSTELGGDSFGYHRIDDDHFAIYLLDVCGHGVGAALLSVTVINVLRASALANADFRDPSTVLKALNDTFPMEKQNNMFFTIWYGVYKASTGELRYATGGHPPSILLRGDARPEGTPSRELLITVGGVAIGALPEMDYDSDVTRVFPGDRLLVISDGTFEVDGPGDDMLSVEALAEHVEAHGSGPLDILAWVKSFNGAGPLPDDFSLLEIRF